MAFIRLAVVASPTDPGGIGVWITTSLPIPVIRYRTDAAQPWSPLAL